MAFCYSLDGGKNTSIQGVDITSEQPKLLYANVVYVKEMNGSIVLFNLSQGWHKLTVYCETPYNDSEKFGIYQDSDSISFFSEATPYTASAPAPEPFPTVTIAVAGSIVATIVIAAFLVTYKIRHKRK